MNGSEDIQLLPDGNGADHFGKSFIPLSIALFLVDINVNSFLSAKRNRSIYFFK